MIKSSSVRIILLNICLSLLSINNCVSAQNLDSLATNDTKQIGFNFNIYELVLNGDKSIKLSGVNVDFYLNDSLFFRTDSTNSNGNLDFKLILKDSSEFILEIKKKNYVTKKVILSTYNISQANDSLLSVDMNLILFKEKTKYDYSFWGNPIGKITFDISQNMFVQDAKFSNSVMKNRIKEELKKVGEYYPEQMGVEY